MQDHSIPLEYLAIAGAEYIASNGKANTIIRSTSGLVSLASSSGLIWIVKRTKVGFTTTYHRILLGMAVSDILYSLGMAHFNFMSPAEDNYYVWNAKGNQATCSAQGFIAFTGSTAGLLYSCSLNLYSLAVVKYEKSDSYIRTKVEPFLHGIPILYSLSTNIALLAGNNFNNGGGGVCYAPIYEPPHCVGYEDGQIREGFDIPCGRGRDGAVIFAYVNTGITIFLTPPIIGVSLWMIYKSVLQTERKIARYGAAAITANAGDVEESDDRNWLPGRVSARIAGSIRSAVSYIKTRGSTGQTQSTTASNQNQSNSRVVLHRAIAFTMAYFLTWSFVIVGVGYDIAGEDWPTALWYLASIFNPLQGFFNFLIFVFPKVTRAKSRGGGDVSWSRAFAIVILYNGKIPTAGRSNRAAQTPKIGAQQQHHGASQGEVKTQQTKISSTVTRVALPALEAEEAGIELENKSPTPITRPGSDEEKIEIKAHE